MGLSFLNSFFLWGLAAAAVPIIIHLIKRSRAVKLPFAAMRFLLAQPDQQMKSQRWKQILLLLMRVAAIVLLALAFARPFIPGADSGPLWGGQSRAAVILIDNSYSMGYEDDFEEAVTHAKKLIQGFRPGDQVTVMQFAETTRMLAEAETDFAVLLRSLDGHLHVSSRSTNYIQAIQAAESVLLESPLEHRIIYLISDFQRSGWSELRPQVEMQPGIQLELVPVSRGESFNLAVTDVLLSTEHEGKTTGDLLVRLANHGAGASDVSATVTINGTKRAVKNVTLPGGQEKVVRFARIYLPEGWASGVVELTAGDKIAADNRFYFVLDNQSQTEVLAVNGEPSEDAAGDELFFLERAVNLPEVAKYKLVACRVDDIGKFDFNDYRAVILANVQKLNRETIERLTYYVRNGGGLILSLGDQVKPNIFNQLFKDLSPATLTNLAFKTANRDGGVILAEIDYQHPVFRLFSDPGQGDPSVARIFQYYHAEPLKREWVLAAFDDGSPAVLERKLGAGTVLLFTSTFDSEWTDLPIKGIFLPLLYQKLQYVAAEDKGRKSYLVGHPVAVRSFGFAPTNDSWQITPPSGEITEFEGDIFTQTDAPGIYEISPTGRGPSAYFAVNVDARESDLAALSVDEVKEKFVQSESAVRSAGVSSRTIHTRTEERQSLWRFAILAVVALLIAETWLANRTYR